MVTPLATDRHPRRFHGVMDRAAHLSASSGGTHEKIAGSRCRSLGTRGEPRSDRRLRRRRGRLCGGGGPLPREVAHAGTVPACAVPPGGLPRWSLPGPPAASRGEERKPLGGFHAPPAADAAYGRGFVGPLERRRAASGREPDRHLATMG